MLIKITNARLSFPKLFKAFANKKEDGTMDEPKFEATFLLASNDPQLKMLADACKQTLREGGIAEKLWPKFKTPMRPGAEKADLDGYGEGVTFFAARRKASKGRPSVVGRRKELIDLENAEKIYAGCYVNATFDSYVSDRSDSKRVCFELRCVQFVKDGEPFSGATKPDAESELDDLGDDDL